MTILQIQKILNEKGFGPLDEDGKTGPKTMAALKKFQLSHGLSGDGIVGPNTLKFLSSPIIVRPEVEKKIIPLDSLSLQRIAKLHPKLRQEAKLILAEINEAVTTPSSFCRITFGLRTFAEQQALYEQGRTKPGQKVTNAKAGQSIHNYGLAVDIAFVINNNDASWDVKKDWDGDKQSDWMEVVSIFKKHGWSWGGDWRSFKDMPHFEKTFGHTWKSLKSLKDKGKVDNEGYVII